jgi:hypothetical protein
MSRFLLYCMGFFLARVVFCICMALDRLYFYLTGFWVFLHASVNPFTIVFSLLRFIFSEVTAGKWNEICCVIQNFGPLMKIMVMVTVW